jgi:hypothetical protein
MAYSGHFQKVGLAAGATQVPLGVGVPRIQRVGNKYMKSSSGSE